MKWLFRFIASIGILGGLAFAAIIGFLVYMQWTYGETDYSRSPDKEGTRRITLKGQSSILTMGGPSHTREWVLDIPKALLLSDAGSNSGSRTVGLGMGLNPETMEVVPNPQSFIGKEGWVNSALDIKNSFALEVNSFPYKIDNYCVDEQELRQQPGGYKSSPPTVLSNVEMIRECNSVNCRFYARFHGWPFEFLITRSEYINKEKYCKFSRELLQKWTVKIEDLRR